MNVARLVFAIVVCVSFLGILFSPHESEDEKSWYAATALFALVLAVLTIITAF